MNSGFFSNSSVGPSSGKELIRAFEKGKLKSQTPVFHAIFTENEWVDFDVTLLKVAYRTLEADRKAEVQRELAIEQDRVKREKEKEQIRFEEEQLRLKEENRQALLDSSWEYNPIVNAIDDSVLHTFSVVAESGTDKFGGPIRLVVRFGNKTADLLIDWGQTCFADKHTSFIQAVRGRAGKQKGGTIFWRVTNDLTGTILPGSYAFHAIRSFFDVDEAVFSVTPYHASPITVIFDVRGLKAELANYRGKIRQIAEVPRKADHELFPGYQGSDWRHFHITSLQNSSTT